MIGDARLAEHRDHVLHRPRRHRQVHEPLFLGVDLGLGVDDRLRQVTPVVGARDDEAEPLGERIPVFVELTATVVLQGIVDVLAELVGGPGRVPARSDDPEVLRHEALAVEVEEPRKQLARGEIARRSEEDEHPIGGAGKCGGGHGANLHARAGAAHECPTTGWGS